MTRITAHVAMRTLERESGSGVVIERGGIPLHTVVTVGARRFPAYCKLSAVNVLVTVFTARRRCFEIRINQFGTHVLRFVAVDTSSGAVSSQQREKVLE